MENGKNYSIRNTYLYNHRHQQVLQQLLQQLLPTTLAFHEDCAHHMCHEVSAFRSDKAVVKKRNLFRIINIAFIGIPRPYTTKFALLRTL